MQYLIRIPLLLLLLTALPLTVSCAQSMYNPAHPEAIPDATPKEGPGQAAQTPPDDPRSAAPHAPQRHPSPSAQGSTPLVVPRGSVVLTPRDMPRRPGPSARLRAGALERCNRHQQDCVGRCNKRSFGQSRNLCYTQCKAQFDKCVKNIDERRR